jgi:hypothetical protein
LNSEFSSQIWLIHHSASRAQLFTCRYFLHGDTNEIVGASNLEQRDAAETFSSIGAARFIRVPFTAVSDERNDLLLRECQDAKIPVTEWLTQLEAAFFLRLHSARKSESGDE